MVTRYGNTDASSWSCTTTGHRGPGTRRQRLEPRHTPWIPVSASVTSGKLQARLATQKAWEPNDNETGPDTAETEGLRFGYWRDTRTPEDRPLVRPATRETHCVSVHQLGDQGIQELSRVRI